MNQFSCFVLGGVVAVVAVAASFTIAQSQQSSSPQDDARPQLPPGWTMDDMIAYAEAGTPGPMHQHLADSAGTWKAETVMWMTPDAEPMHSTGRSTVTPIMDGRFFKVEMTGQMPGMGVYNGMGIYGYDNVAEEFQGIWIDNHGTGMMRGTGQLSDDGKTLTWDYAYNCPLREGPCKMHEIERITGENTKTLEMHGTDPKSGKEFKIMEINFTRQGTAASADRTR